GASFVFIQTIDESEVEGRSGHESKAVRSGERHGGHISLGRFGLGIFAKSARVNAWTLGIGDAGGGADQVAKTVAGQYARMCLRFNTVAKGTGIVRVGWRLNRLVSEDAIENSDLPIQTVADGHP